MTIEVEHPGAIANDVTVLERISHFHIAQSWGVNESTTH